MKPESELAYRHILSKAWPIMLANAAVPALSLVDTAVIGHLGSTSELAGLAIAGLMFSFIYWGFGFLRMATTAYVAQADGAKDYSALMLVVLQSLITACILAIAIIAVQKLLLYLGLTLLNPPRLVALEASRYFEIRIWGAPATLAVYVFGGYLIGRGFSKQLLLLQLFLNGSNAALDIVFAGYLGWGIEGLAWGTVIAEYATLVLAVMIIARHHPWLGFIRSLNVARFSANMGMLLNQNSDIFIRTLFLLLGFAFFTRTSGGFGEDTLAANHILLQLISFSAFFLDGFAHVLESLVGKAIGRRSVLELDSVLKKSSVLAGLCAIGLAIIVLLVGQDIVQTLTNKNEVIVLATHYLPYVAIYIFLSVAAFQLDGLYIGAAYGSAMRNCSIISTFVLLVSWYMVLHHFGNTGLWWAFIVYVCARALSLLVYLPKLRVRCKNGTKL